MVQEDTREVGPVAPVDLRAEKVHTLHLSKSILCLGGFPDLYIHTSREDSQERDRQWCHKTHSGSKREIIWHWDQSSMQT